MDVKKKKLLRTKIISIYLNSLIYDVLIFSTRMKSESQPTKFPIKKKLIILLDLFTFGAPK